MEQGTPQATTDGTASAQASVGTAKDPQQVLGYFRSVIPRLQSEPDDRVLDFARTYKGFENIAPLNNPTQQKINKIQAGLASQNNLPTPPSPRSWWDRMSEFNPMSGATGRYLLAPLAGEAQGPEPAPITAAKTAWEDIKSAGHQFLHPGEALSQIQQISEQHHQEGAKAYAQGDKWLGASHTLASYIPVLGPMIYDMAAQAGQDPATIVGHMAAGLALSEAPKAAGKTVGKYMTGGYGATDRFNNIAALTRRGAPTTTPPQESVPVHIDSLTKSAREIGLNPAKDMQVTGSQEDLYQGVTPQKRQEIADRLGKSVDDLDPIPIELANRAVDIEHRPISNAVSRAANKPIPAQTKVDILAQLNQAAATETAGNAPLADAIGQRINDVSTANTFGDVDDLKVTANKKRPNSRTPTAEMNATANSSYAYQLMGDAIRDHMYPALEQELGLKDNSLAQAGMREHHMIQGRDAMLMGHTAAAYNNTEVPKGLRAWANYVTKNTAYPVGTSPHPGASFMSTVMAPERALVGGAQALGFDNPLGEYNARIRNGLGNLQYSPLPKLLSSGIAPYGLPPVPDPSSVTATYAQPPIGGQGTQWLDRSQPRSGQLSFGESATSQSPPEKPFQQPGAFYPGASGTSTVIRDRNHAVIPDAVATGEIPVGTIPEGEHAGEAFGYRRVAVDRNGQIIKDAHGNPIEAMPATEYGSTPNPAMGGAPMKQGQLFATDQTKPIWNPKQPETFSMKDLMDMRQDIQNGIKSNPSNKSSLMNDLVQINHEIFRRQEAMKVKPPPSPAAAAAGAGPIASLQPPPNPNQGQVSRQMLQDTARRYNIPLDQARQIIQNAGLVEA